MDSNISTPTTDSLAVNTAERRYPNFARCSAVVIEVFPKIMQKLLATQIKAVDLHNIVTNHRDFKTILNGNEMYTIQSLKTNGFSKLNFTLIYKILKFNFIKSITHKWGAVPLENEIEIGDDVERMRFARQNLVYRIDCDMQTSEFETFFTDFVKLGKRVDIHLKESKNSGWQRDIECLKKNPMDDCQQKEYIEAIKDPEYLKDTSHFTSEENKHLSEFMNGTIRSLAVARLQQKYVERHNTITEILCGLLKIPYMAFVGSIAEGTDDKSDKDTIWFSDYYDGFDSLTILPDERHPGYSKIQVDNISENSELKDYTVEIDGQNYLKNSVKKLIVKDRALRNFPFELSSHGAAYTAEMHYKPGESILLNRDREEVDHVFCIKRPDWPDEAAEWKTRIGHSNWPTDELFVKITQSGYLLTAVGSKESIDSEIQWRVSFNEAELLLIKSFNETQLHCILLLKLLKKDLSDIAAESITSYTMKNIMFWCLEEKSIDFWQPSNLMCCFRFCLSKLLSFVETEFFPNYFIKERNLFISSEFTPDKRIKTSQYLESFINDPKTRISLLLPSGSDYVTTEICRLQINTKRSIVVTWLKNQVSMASRNLANFVKGLLRLYDGHNIQNILKRCNEALDKLTKVEYTQPLIKKLQNYMGVLQYILLRNENERSSDSRNKYSDFMALSASADLTHNTLRSATCYLDDDEKERCLRTIKTVTDLGSQYFKQTHSQCLEEKLACSVKEIKKFDDGQEIESILNIINKIDLIKTDPYTTTDEFVKLKASRHSLILVDILNLAWKRCYFDVTFMQAELSVLPKPAALELCTCIGKGQEYVSFHPFLYGLLLEYLWQEKYGSGNEEKELVLTNMKKCISIIPDEQKSIGLHFIAYCSSLQKDNRAA